MDILKNNSVKELEFKDQIAINGGIPTEDTSLFYDIGYYIGSGIEAIQESDFAQGFWDGLTE